VLAKCIGCNSCLRIIRVDLETDAKVVWYCSLCDKMYNFKKSTQELLDEELQEKVKETYIKWYGNTLS
jgi:hypothetical protein